MRILVIEDEQELRRDLEMGLHMIGYAVDSAADGQEALDLYAVNSYDLLLLDLNLPKVDGMEVLHTIRSRDQDVKILILSARDTVEDRVEGLDAGSNDYLVKPFHFEELLARIRGLLRRKFETAPSCLCCGPVSLDQSTGEVTVAGHPVVLRPKEYGILHYLMMHPNRYVSQEELLEHVWDENADPFTASVRVYVSYLRKKLAPFLREPDFILSAPSKGYMVRKDLEK